ncbi:hypothetical protein A7982_13513 [Minicystis rosea]|nr:hypothetical protein A7982_13513 [Minicystis rosea]
MLRDPSALSATPRGRAIAGFASLLTDAPWTVDDGDFARLREGGLDDEAIVQVVTIAAVFNHLVRMADGTGIEADYPSPLPRFEVDRDREPLPRPERADWPVPRPRLSLSLRPASEAAIAGWRAYIFTEGAGLSARDRAVIARTVAWHVCDAASVEEHGEGPRDAREATLAAYAEKLTVSPWRMSAEDLAPLRAEGLDDRGVVHVIATVGLQNALSRLWLALG